MHFLVTAFALLLSLVALSENSQAQAPHIELQPVLHAPLSGPLFVTDAHDGSHRLFVLEQQGRILVLQPGATSATLFLDLTNKVLTGTERGLLGLAFHPQFSTNRRFFVDYSRKPDGAIVVAEYHASVSNPRVADLLEAVVLTIPHPNLEHYGGMLEFGPDGFLYISTGDGGLSYDPPNNAQNVNSLLGKILRIDIDNPASATVRYSSPSSNPFFAEKNGRDEIYALGFRNPWRFSFDSTTQEIYAADVGQDALEEIDVVVAGGNYGWRIFEGTLCTNRGPTPCEPDNHIGPIFEYGHTGRGGRCSITGGYVYRGNKQTLPFGAYVYGDYCTGEIFMLYRGEPQLLLDTAERITSFGEDEDGELYVAGGTVDRIVNTGSPFIPATPFELTSGGSVSFVTQGASERISVEHAQIQPNEDDSRPAAVAFIGYRENGVLISEAAIPATSLIESGRFYAEIGAGTDTGVAMANPDMAQAATVTFNFTDGEGNDFGAGQVRIPPGGQIAAFLDQAPFYGPSDFNGTLTFSASVPLSVIALRGITNERSEFLITTLPVGDIHSVGTDRVVVPHFAAGGGWATDVILVNPSDEFISGKVQFLSPAGRLQETMLDGTTGGEAFYSVPGRSARKLRVTSRKTISVGSFVVVPDTGHLGPVVAAIYTYGSGVIISATGVEAARADTEFSIYSEVTGQFGTVGSIQTGLAVGNPSGEETAVDFDLTAVDGTPSGVAGTLRIPPNGQLDAFVDQLPGAQNLPRPFQGTLRLRSSKPIAVIAIRGRYNERGDFLFTTSPPDDLATPSEGFIPQVVDGAGYTTQIVIFGGPEGSPVSGNMYFFDQNGQPIDPLWR